MSGDGPLARMTGIVKRFGPVVANAGIDFAVHPGEIHALLGENGAGKTTLMNVLYGLTRPDAGEIFLHGRAVRLRSPLDAIAEGVGMVHQHFMLVPTLTVAENTMLGERGGALLRRSEVAAVRRSLGELGDRYGLDVDPDARVWQLSVGERHRVEILRALHRHARLLILDEPTASLAPTEIEHLLPRLREMAADGAAIVIITHHLDEVMAVADRITVLRRGERVATLRPEETSAAELARLMVGRDVALVNLLTGEARTSEEGSAGGQPAGLPLFEVSNLEARSDRGLPALRQVSFTVGAGEVVAVAGVDGSGQAEMEEVLFGLRRPTGGGFRLLGRDLTGLGPAELMAAGIGLIPSDRYRRGLIGQLSAAENLVFDRIDREPFGTHLSIRRRPILARARELIERFSIRVESPATPARTLSGGNSPASSAGPGSSPPTSGSCSPRNRPGGSTWGPSNSYGRSSGRSGTRGPGSC